MSDALLPEQHEFTLLTAAMIAVALTGAVFLAIGTQMQSRGVRRVEARLGQQTRGLSVRHVLNLLSSGSWVLGTLMLGVAVVLQLTSITFAPLIVVQPLGAVALVFTTWFSSRSRGVPLGRGARRAVWTCILGVGLFTLIAARYAHDSTVTRPQLGAVIALLIGLLVLVGLSFRYFSKRGNALYYIVGAGVLYGFVATLAKVSLNRLIHHNFDWLTIFAIIGIIGAATLGGYFVQNAYSAGSADLVVAGLTVVDPIVAVSIGIIVLNEAPNVPGIAVLGFAIAATIAIVGVGQLARHHPATR